MTSPQVIDLDVERALQHAIGQANSAFATGVPSTDMVPNDAPLKKGKKRAREDAREETEPRKEKKRKKKAHAAGELPAVPASVNEETSLAMHRAKPEKRRKHAAASSTYAQPALAGTAIDPSTLLGDPSSSTSPSQTAALISSLASTSSHHLPANQITQDFYYPPPSLPHFPNFNSEENSLPLLNTNDEILRAFQDLDLTRLAGVLRSLDVPFSPLQSNAMLGDSLHGDALQGDAGTPFLNEVFSSTPNVGSTSNTTTVTSTVQSRGARDATGSSGTSKKLSTKASKPVAQPNPNLAAIGPSIASPEHTHLLATKWLSAAKLKALVETEGLVYKKGKFSALEEQALKAAIENYRVNRGLSAEQLIDVIFSKSKEDNTFWSEITASVPARPIIAVYHHVHRAYHPLKNQGKWSDDEDTALIQAVRDHGQAWQKVSGKVGRMAQDCRDRWKNHLAHRSERQRGHWTKEEEEELTRIVTEVTTKQGKTSDNDVFWGVVSQRMGNKRGRQQCRIKWTDSLSKTLKNSGSTPRWSKQDSFTLVRKVASLDVRDDSEIDWNVLSDPDWNLWSAHLLQRRWRSFKLSIKGYETMPFEEILEILQQKHAEPPYIGEVSLTRSRVLPRKEPKSSELIEEDEEEDGAVEHESDKDGEGEVQAD